MKKRSIYIIQAHTGTIPSRAIRLFTRYNYTHILLSMDSSFEKMYSFGRRTLNNPLNAGFTIESKNGKFYTKFNKTKCRLFEIKTTDKQYDNVLKILKNYEEHPEKYDYDILGLLLRVFKIRIKRKNHYVCSQFVAEVIDSGNIHKFSKPTQNIEPKDFEKIPGTHIIYSGDLNKLKLN